MKEKLHDVEVLDEELARDADVRPAYELPGKVKQLHNEFADTCEKLDELKKFPGKGELLFPSKTDLKSWNVLNGIANDAFPMIIE